MKELIHPASAEETESDRPVRILWAEDDSSIRQCVSWALSRAGYTVTATCNGQAAWEALNSATFDLLVTDNRMPCLTGEELVLRVRTEGMTLPILVAASDTKFFADPRNRWLDVATLEKPFGLREMTESVRRILHVERLAESSASANVGSHRGN